MRGFVGWVFAKTLCEYGTHCLCRTRHAGAVNGVGLVSMINPGRTAVAIPLGRSTVGYFFFFVPYCSQDRQTTAVICPCRGSGVWYLGAANYFRANVL